MEPHVGKQRQDTWGRKDEEYIADFELVTHRTLQPEEFKLFRYHFLLGADWKLCTRKLGLNRGNFFHSIYRIERKLGQTFRELQPYALFPVDEYFHGVSRRGPQITACIPKKAPRKIPEHLRFPAIGRAA